ncbi:TPA: metal-sulfur cluster assembly factor [Candidatus Woesearchaeota archaeon]|nr:metal-sulfur cluster assembly factor [Candidatus Woesearchaeota archaeon]HIH47237.1 metal-sulfur cluster assembly factor [Candidatus Woesearchaeota archaeon]HII88064.1 metal-sulfur cluster assembly factor [Candidatus Woesearchaeota archaeon]
MNSDTDNNDDIEILPLTQEHVIEVLKVIDDPELHIDVMTLGLIYDTVIDEKKKSIDIRMTFTTPLCPYGEILVEMIHTALTEQFGLAKDKVNIEVVFDPPWKPTDEIKAMLGIM